MGVLEDYIEDADVPEAFRDAQRLLDNFAGVSFEAAHSNMEYPYRDDAYGSNSSTYLKRQVLELLTANPPLATVPGYFNDGREEYLWYSDFFDDASKDCFKRYATFAAPVTKITPANYTEELAKIDLPYFKELVRLVSLLKLIGLLERHATKKNKDESAIRIADAATPAITEHSGSVEVTEENTTIATEYESAMVIREPEPPQATTQTESDPPAVEGQEHYTPQPRRLVSPTRSYAPTMTEGQYSLVEECINTLNIFKRTIRPGQLHDLLAGKQPCMFHVTNQKNLTYLFDLLAESGYIGKRWISVAGHNQDFVSVPKRGRDKNKPAHYITSQQFTNCRHANQSEAIKGLNTIEDLLEQMPKA